jgi:hypothetical protein
MLAALIVSALLTQASPPELTVYLFTTTDCPISNRYAPEIQRLAAKFGARARFVLVYPVPTDSPEKISAHKKTFGYALESVRDADQTLVKMTGASVLPEAAVMRGATLLYRGRIDDRYIDFGKDRHTPTQRDLENALDAALAGKPIAAKYTQAIGCILSDLIK